MRRLINIIVPPLLVFAVIANISAILYFKLRIDKKYQDSLVSYQKYTDSRLSVLTSNALDRIDYYFYSNLVSILQSNLDSKPIDIVSSTNTIPILPTVSSVRFHYYKINDTPFVRVAGYDYMIGDLWPQGGLITSINPLCIIINGTHIINNILDNDSSKIQPPTTQNQFKNDV